MWKKEAIGKQQMRQIEKKQKDDRINPKYANNYIKCK